MWCGFANFNPLSWIFNAISNEKSCLISMTFLPTYIDVRTVLEEVFPACWILIGQFKSPARQRYVRSSARPLFSLLHPLMYFHFSSPFSLFETSLQVFLWSVFTYNLRELHLMLGSQNHIDSTDQPTSQFVGESWKERLPIRGVPTDPHSADYPMDYPHGLL